MSNNASTAKVERHVSSSTLRDAIELRHAVVTSVEQLTPTKFQELFEGIDFCCFDLFDTIISRKVDPEYIKIIWAHRVITEFGLPMHDQDLYKIRSSLEGVICKANRESGLDDDLRYLHFARSLYVELKRAGHNLGGVTEWEFAERVLDIEVEVELKNQFQRPEGVALLKAAHASGKRCIAISDTYMPYRAISKFLKGLEVFHYFDRLFLSSEPLITKRSGRLYRYALDTLRATPSRCIMIGDNPYSDVERGTFNGLNTLHLPVSHQGEKGRDQFWSSYEDFEAKVQKIAEGRTFPFWEILLPLAVFCRDLHRHIASKGIHHLFFCSREGQPLMRFYELYRAKVPSPLPYSSHYLYVSRRSTFLPGCGPLEEETFEPLFRQYRNISALEFLQSLGLDEAEAREVVKGLPSAEQKFTDFPETDQFKRLKELPAFRAWYERARREQHAILWSHLSEMGELETHDSINIVDVGWKGTIQDNLRRVLPNEIRLNGFYLGILLLLGESPINAKFASVFSNAPGLNRFYDLYSESCSLFEILLAADHGSVKRYSKGGIGELLPVLDEQVSERSLFDAKLQPLLSKMYEVFPDVAELFSRYDGCEDALRKFVILKFMRPVLAPTPEEVGIVNGIQHYENFGLFSETAFGRTQRVGRMQRCKNALAFLLSPRAFRNATPWPALEFHRQGIGKLRGLYVRDRLAHWFGTPPSRALKVAWGVRRIVKIARSAVGR